MPGDAGSVEVTERSENRPSRLYETEGDVRVAPGLKDPLAILRSAGKRVTDPVESLAQQIAERVVEAIVAVLDVDAIVSRVDVDALLDRIDVNRLLARVDVDRLLARVDVDRLVTRADVNAVLDRVDVDRMLTRVDMNEVLDRVDVNDVAGRIDMDMLVEQTDLGAVIARSSGGVATEALDSVRSQAVGADDLIDRWARRLLRRKNQAPAGPPALTDAPASP